MNLETTGYRDAVDHLPSGAMLVFPHISWDDYERLLRELADRPGTRVSFDEGRLEIMSVLPEHEEYKDSLYRMVCAFAEVRGIPLETRGSTTWKRKSLQKGTEPDTCFYVANAQRVVGRRNIALDVGDPPPDVVVEIDTTNESLSKVGIYAALGVPEIWRYDGKRAFLYRLVGGAYSTIDESLALPGLSVQGITGFLEDSKARGQSAALTAFRKDLRRKRRNVKRRSKFKA